MLQQGSIVHVTFVCKLQRSPVGVISEKNELKLSGSNNKNDSKTDQPAVILF